MPIRGTVGASNILALRFVHNVFNDWDIPESHAKFEISQRMRILDKRREKKLCSDPLQLEKFHRKFKQSGIVPSKAPKTVLHKSIMRGRGGEGN